MFLDVEEPFLDTLLDDTSDLWNAGSVTEGGSGIEKKTEKS